MRLIDAEPIEIRYNTEALGRREMYEMVKTAPSIDAVPVVRCKDCKWHQDNATWEDFINHCKWISTETPDENDFCSCGERKDNE